MPVETKLDSALALAKLGFWVFPLVPKSKLPLIEAWQHHATQCPRQIKSWWIDPVMGFFQDWNVGILTTRYGNDSALWVIDVDNKGQKRGNYELVRMELEGFEFPPTLEQATPTGGRHLVYVVDEPVGSGANVLAPGLDIRSRGGFIVGAGSETERGRYRLCGSRSTPARAPDWYRQVSSHRNAARPADRAHPPAGVNQDAAILRAVDWLTRQAPHAVEGQGGDATTYAVCCRVKDFGVGRDECLRILADHWNPHCSPPWSIEELERKVANAYRYGKEVPGAAAPEMQFSDFRGERESVSAGVADEPAVHPFEILNRNFAFVLAGGGSHILWETDDAKGNPTLEHLNQKAFHDKFAAWTLQVGDKNRPVTEEWMRHPSRRSYDGICFLPGREAPERFYNLWRGFAVNPLPPGETPSDEARAALAAFLDHAGTNVCGADETLTRWLIGYFAHMVQRPWEKPLVSLVFKGEKGVGKNALIERVGHLLGSHFLVTSNRRYLVGNFNGHLERLLLFVLDEAFWSGDKQAEGTLKDLITGAQHVIEHKGKEPYTVDNKTRIAIIGNEDWLVPASHDERRFAVFDVGSGRKQDRHYFREMREGMEMGGYRLLLAHLQAFDLEGLDFNEAPHTSGLLDQKHASLEPFYQWWLDCLLEGQIVGSDFGGAWPERAETSRFRASFRRYVKERNIRSRVPEDRAIGRILKQIAPGIGRRREREGQELLYVYTLPPLEQCREAWDKYIGHAVAWGD